MKDVILKQAEQIRHSLAVNEKVKITGNFDSIILAGMGGSGHPGDLMNALGLATKPLFVHRNYDLPLSYLGGIGCTKTLAIASSYSGNTEEALSAYQHARANNIPLLASSAGGQLKELAEKDNVPFCLIDYPAMQPRHTLLAAFTGIYVALKNSGLARDITGELLRVADKLDEITPTLAEPGRALADKIKGKIPVYMSSDNLGFAAKNFKIQTNENAKYPAFWNTFPELNHNEMVGFSKMAQTNNPNKFLALMIHDPADHPRNVARMKVTADLYESWGVTVEHFEARGTTLLEKIFYTVTFGLWTTYFIAKEHGVDPIPVDGVEDFKTKLKEVAGII